jgi:hypothetical protein
MGLGPFAHPQILDGADRRRSPDQVGVRNCGKKSLVDGREAPIIMDEYVRIYPQWSPDGMHLAYWREKSAIPDTAEGEIVLWSFNNHSEEALTTSQRRPGLVYEWSPDSKEILVTQTGDQTHRDEVWAFPVSAAPHAESGLGSLSPVQGTISTSHTSLPTADGWSL